MPESAPSDADLLAAWLKRRHEPSFHAMVSRYAGLVHMAAKRTCWDESLAAEASQLTFILLARKAASLANRTSLAGWLHRTAVRQAQDLLRQSRREHGKRERLAMELHSPSPDEAWQDLQPAIDDALAALSEKDREALLLRFYRSLSVREVGEALGIATDAAQKRIHRATERLRGKLTRRGCQAGGSLTGVMIAGFTADAQATVPAVSVLASKAIAAGAAGTGVVSTATSFLTAAAMKTTTLTIPLVALLAVGAWIASQRYSMAELQTQNARLEQNLGMITKMSARERPGSPKRMPDTKGPTNWKAVAAQLIDMRPRDFPGYMQIWRSWQLRLASMDAAELTRELDVIDTLELSSAERSLFLRMFIEPLIDKDPEQAVKRFPHHEKSPVRVELATAMAEWLRRDPGNAMAWFDAQIAAGTFDERSLAGKAWGRIHFETAVFRVLMETDFETAERRLAALPEGYRRQVLESSFPRQWRDDQLIAFASMVRRYSPEKEQAGVFAEGLVSLPQESGYAGVSSYLERIQATPTDRAACAREALDREINRALLAGKVNREVFDRFREWAQVEAPEAVEGITGKFLAQGRGGMPVAETVVLAVEYFAASGRDGVLEPMLEQHRKYMKEHGQTLALAISDESRRARFLARLDAPLSPSDALSEQLKEFMEKSSR